MSRERYFTRGMFPGKDVIVSGNSPLPKDQRKVSIDKLVSKVLCRKHNTELSPLDTALIDLVNAFREAERLRMVRAQNAKKKWPPVRLTVDGMRIECCVLKMLMNHAVVQRDILDNWEPPEWVPAVVFGQRALAEGCGLGMLARAGDQMNNAEEFSLFFGESFRARDYECVLFSPRRGWRFLCSWGRPLNKLGLLQFPGAIYSADEDVLCHPNRINIEEGGRSLGISIDFDWSGKWTERRFPKVVALRGRYGPPSR